MCDVQYNRVLNQRPIIFQQVLVKSNLGKNDRSGIYGLRSATFCRHCYNETDNIVGFNKKERNSHLVCTCCHSDVKGGVIKCLYVT